ncbi:Dynein heavy chain, partial [Aduncisulcus paluster]
HFNMITFPEMDNESLQHVFGTILTHWIDTKMTKAPGEVSTAFTQVVKSTVDVFNTIRRELLPTPLKSHYTFNLRDLSAVFVGVLMGNPKKLTDKLSVVKLWCHECERVFSDRLISVEDRSWFRDLLCTKCKDDFRVVSENVYVKEKGERLIFADFMVDTDPRPYEEIGDFKKLREVCYEFQEDYITEMNGSLKLVLFDHALDHLARIARVLRQPKGHALLLGVGGSGRQSLTRLASYINEFEIFQIEISKSYGIPQWHEDLKNVLQMAGLKRKPTVFLFNDTQLFNESQLEDLNNILNTGDVPTIYEPPELENIYNTMRPICQAEGKPLT